MADIHKTVVLDWDTVSNNDIQHDEILAPGKINFYGLTKPEEVIQRIGDSSIVLCNKVLITEQIMNACPSLKYIGLFATGFNNIDLNAAKDRGITVCNAGSYSTDAVAQHTFALILHHFSKVALYGNYVADGGWIKSPTFSVFPFPVYELAGKTIAIVGFGSIGKAVAKIAEAFNMNILVCTRTKPENSKYELVSPEEAFRRADILTCHCPLTESTKGFISRDRLSLMKKSALIINTSRGPVADEKALADALNSEQIAGAGLDVLEYEPMRPDSPLLGAKNCVITPHVAWAPLETRRRLISIVNGNLKAFLEGKPTNVVNH